jgi:hypothetical protein
MKVKLQGHSVGKLKVNVIGLAAKNTKTELIMVSDCLANISEHYGIKPSKLINK